MVFWMFDTNKSSRVDYDKVTGEVLVIAGAEDKCCVPTMCKATARQYGTRGRYAELAGSDHMMIGGPYMQATLQAFDAWATAVGISGNTLTAV